MTSGQHGFARGRVCLRRCLAVAVLLALAASGQAAGAAGGPASFKDCDACPEMVVVPAGSFVMGSPGLEDGRDADEDPPHRVVIARPFAVGRFEVTRGEWAAFVRATRYAADDACHTYEGGEWRRRSPRSWRAPAFRQTDRHPVVCVAWGDAKAYVRWLSWKTGKAYRLLSEAEWEYAARAGTATARFWGERADDGCDFANGYDETGKSVLRFTWPHARCDDGHAYSAPAGTYRANGFGLHDTIGNVWEWVEDCWTASYAGASPDGAASTAGGCSLRGLRGGSWNYATGSVRAADRGRDGIAARSVSVGFRVAREP